MRKTEQEQENEDKCVGCFLAILITSFIGFAIYARSEKDELRKENEVLRQELKVRQDEPKPIPYAK